jgi:hypothetical protein
MEIVNEEYRRDITCRTYVIMCLGQWKARNKIFHDVIGILVISIHV